MAIINNLTTFFNTPIYTSAPTQIGFRAAEVQTFDNFVPSGDKFTTNPIHTSFESKREIISLAKSSPRIMELLNEYNLINKYKILSKPNIKALDNLKKGHLTDTRIVAAKMYSALPQELKNQINLEDVQQAAMLHDFGKVLIPEEILGKKGQLTEEEKKIMNLHSEFGYELLKQKGVKESVLNLIKYHHQKPNGKGYPAVDKDFEYSLSLQILIAADKYSALTEDRCYRKAMSKTDAINKIKEEDADILSKEVLDALETLKKYD